MMMQVTLAVIGEPSRAAAKRSTRLQPALGIDTFDGYRSENPDTGYRIRDARLYGNLLRCAIADIVKPDTG